MSAFWAGIAEGLGDAPERAEKRRSERRRDFMGMLEVLGKDATEEDVNELLGAHFMSDYERERAGIGKNFASSIAKRNARMRSEAEEAQAAQRIQNIHQVNTHLDNTLVTGASQGEEGFRTAFESFASDPLISKSPAFAPMLDAFKKDPAGLYGQYRQRVIMKGMSEFGGVSPAELRQSGVPLSAQPDFAERHEQSWIRNIIPKARQAASTPGDHKQFLTEAGARKYFAESGVMNPDRVDVANLIERANETEMSWVKKRESEDRQIEAENFALDAKRSEAQEAALKRFRAQLMRDDGNVTFEEVKDWATIIGRQDEVTPENYLEWHKARYGEMKNEQAFARQAAVTKADVDKMVGDKLTPLWGKPGEIGGTNGDLHKRQNDDINHAIKGIKNANDPAVGALRTLRSTFMGSQVGEVLDWVVNNPEGIREPQKLAMAAVEMFGLKDIQTERAEEQARIRANIVAGQEVPPALALDRARDIAQAAVHHAPEVHKLTEALKSMSPDDFINAPDAEMTAFLDSIRAIRTMYREAEALMGVYRQRHGDSHEIVRAFDAFITQYKKFAPVADQFATQVNERKNPKAPTPTASGPTEQVTEQVRTDVFGNTVRQLPGGPGVDWGSSLREGVPDVRGAIERMSPENSRRSGREGLIASAVERARNAEARGLSNAWEFQASVLKRQNIEVTADQLRAMARE